MTKLTINSKSSLSDAIGALREAFEKYKYFDIRIYTGKSRSIQQNAISHAWYLQVAREEREYTAGKIKCLCKYHFGLPILRGDDEYYNDKCAKFIDPLPYESRIEAMELWPCTSLMKTKQLSEYLEAIQAHYAGRVVLEFPDE